MLMIIYGHLTIKISNNKLKMRFYRFLLLSIGTTSAILGTLYFLFIIGITTDFSSDKIEDNELAKCKEIVSIIDRNKEFINKRLVDEAIKGFKDSSCIGYLIENKTDIIKLFSKINSVDSTKLVDLVGSKFCEYIEISEPKDCIMFQMRRSRHNWAIIGEYKILYVIYENKPNCNCKDNPIGNQNFVEYVKKISDNYYLTKVRQSSNKWYFGC